MSIRAVLVDPSAPDALRLGEAPEPMPGPSQVVVEVQHASLNYGDLNDARSGRVPPGAVLGSDAAGVVARSADDGSGPAVGARVVGLARGAFAERTAVDVGTVAEVPRAVDLAAAAALPVAGLAALRALRAVGPLLGRRVLITGASGGVGRFAVQLAARAGAQVIASVGSVVRAEGLADRGADEVVVGLEGLDEQVVVVLDNVGGPELVKAWGMLAGRQSAEHRLDLGRAGGVPPVLDGRAAQVAVVVSKRGRVRRGSGHTPAARLRRRAER